ncbi:MAG: DNA polymerase III subunit delta' [Pseudomonadales bacterium]|nr:DNA polymerase III subunit delta' [Pseudomonadales bacterium]
MTIVQTDPLQIPLPWQIAQWQKSLDSFGSGLMSHAQIFCGVSGLGKREYAAALTQHIFCLSLQNGLGCSECRNCRLILAEVHPDVLKISPEKPGSAIKVDEIRSLNEFVNCTSESGIAKVVLIEEADRMNRNAANALLKNLEEPPANTFFFLVSSREMQLPITVRSRCQRINFSAPDRRTTIEWLQQQNTGSESCELPVLLAAGAPLAAQRLISDACKQRYTALFTSLESLITGRSNPTIEAKSLMDSEQTELLCWISSWIAGVAKAQNSSSVENVETGCTNLDEQVRQVSLMVLLSFGYIVQRAFLDSCAVSNINKQLILENLLMSWQRLMRPRNIRG